MILTSKEVDLKLEAYEMKLDDLRSTKSTNTSRLQSMQRKYAGSLLLTGASITIYIVYKYYDNFNKKYTIKSEKLQSDDTAKELTLTSREKIFLLFASVIYNEQTYMTPKDFLQSLIETEPKDSHIAKKVLTEQQINYIKNCTPSQRHSTTSLFKDLSNNGIISYTEYLFLLSILIKPESGFRIAFNMIDTDRNGHIDKNEFLMMEMIFGNAWKERHDTSKDTNELNEESGDNRLRRTHSVDTTLLIHFFGPNGTDKLSYENFMKFMVQLQCEVLELEFHQFSKGLSTISEIDFAKILLRYTHLDVVEYDMYLTRLIQQINNNHLANIGITFNDFSKFCKFLNNLDDFAIAMHMYTMANQSISMEEFCRAAKICTGHDLSSHIVHTVFTIFDENADGLLSYQEFIAIMKDRLHRSFKAHIKSNGWRTFINCVKQKKVND